MKVLKEARHYWEVYKKFSSTNSAVCMSFRTSFALLILMDLVFYFTSLASVDFIFNHIESLGPWNKNQFMFFLSFMLAIDNLHMMLISESFWVLSFDIRTGQFDYTLIRPLHSIFISFFRYFRPSSLVNVPVIWSVLIYYGHLIDLPILSWIALPIVMALGFTLLIVMEFIIAASMFWMTEGLGINFLRMQFQQLARWPHFIFSSLPRKILTTIVPVLLIGSAPVELLIGGDAWYLMTGLIVAIIVFSLILKRVWNIAISQYDSASS